MTTPREVCDAFTWTQCPIEGCHKPKQSGVLFCVDCWSLVPRDQRIRGVRLPGDYDELGAWLAPIIDRIERRRARGVESRKWRRTAAVLVSDCGNFTMETKRLPDGAWSWNVRDAKSELVGHNVCRQSDERRAEQAARAGAKRKVRALQRAKGAPGELQPPSVEEVRRQIKDSLTEDPLAAVSP